jgi:hypothetical protein
VFELDEATGVAVVHDCQDSSSAGLVDARTGQVLTRGPKANEVTATLHRLGGRWRIVFLKHSGGSCSW